MGYTKDAKPSIAWILYPIIYYLLREQGDYLLTEAGGKIVLTGLHPSREWTKDAKPSIP